MKVRRFSSREALDAAVADRLRQAVAIEGGALMLAGGKTPQQAYVQIGTRPLQTASDLHVLYSDERHVPPDSAASNYHASQPLLNALALPEDRVLRVRTELPLAEAAADYEQRLRKLLNVRIAIDVGLLGLGTDGHTASLFSLGDLERARDRLAVPVQRPDGLAAISVTPELLTHVTQLLFVVAGADKQAALAAFVAGDSSLVASHAIAGCANVEAWCDASALPHG